MTYQHPHQLPTTTFPLSNPNTQTLPPALMQALHRLAIFSSDIQLLTSHFAPQFHFHAHHPYFSKTTPQHFARRRKPTTRSTAWRLQNLQPSNPITHLPASNVTPSSLIATPIINAPLRPVSAPPFNPGRHGSEIPRPSSVPPCITRSRTQTEPERLAQYDLSTHQSDESLSQNSIKPRSMTSASTAIDLISTEHPLDLNLLVPATVGPAVTTTTLGLAPDTAVDLSPITTAIDLTPVHFVSESTSDVGTESIHDSSETGDNSVTPDKVGEALIRPAIVQVVSESQTATADNPGRAAAISPPRIPAGLASVTDIDLILNAIKPAIISSPVPVIEDQTSSAANVPIVHALDSQTFSNDDPTLTAAINLSPTSDSGMETDPPPATNSSIKKLIDLDVAATAVGSTPFAGVSCETFGDFEQQTVANVDQSRPADSVLNVDKELADDGDQEPDTTKIVSPPRVSSDLASATEIDSNLKAIKPAVVLNLDPVIENLLSSASNQQIFANGDLALTADVDLAPASDSSPAIAPIPNAPDPTIKTVINDTLLSSTAIDPRSQPSATIGPLIDDLGLVKSEVIHPLQVFVSAINFGSNTDIPTTSSPFPPLTNTVTSQINNTSSSTNKKKKKKKNKKKTLVTDNNLSEQHYREYDVTEYFHPQDGWIENDRHSSGYPISLDVDTPPLPQHDTRTSSTSNTLHPVDLIQKLLFRHRMYELLQVIEEGIILGKEPGQDPNHQDVIFYSHEGEFMFRRTKDAKIFCDLDELED